MKTALYAICCFCEHSLISYIFYVFHVNNAQRKARSVIRYTLWLLLSIDLFFSVPTFSSILVSHFWCLIFAPTMLKIHYNHFNFLFNTRSRRNRHRHKEAGSEYDTIPYTYDINATNRLQHIQCTLFHLNLICIVNRE